MTGSNLARALPWIRQLAMRLNGELPLDYEEGQLVIAVMAELLEITHASQIDRDAFPDHIELRVVPGGRSTL
jgi:hypothetical protein